MEVAWWLYGGCTVVLKVNRRCLSHLADGPELLPVRGAAAVDAHAAVLPPARRAPPRVQSRCHFRGRGTSPGR
jgi:hypothetical protein